MGGLLLLAETRMVTLLRPTHGATSTLATGAIDPAEPKLSTSKLAAKLGLGSAGALLVKLAAEGLLVKDGNGYALTDAGKATGGGLVEKSRYGPYFVWPSSLRVNGAWRWRTDHSGLRVFATCFCVHALMAISTGGRSSPSAVRRGEAIGRTLLEIASSDWNISRR